MKYSELDKQLNTNLYNSYIETEVYPDGWSKHDKWNNFREFASLADTPGHSFHGASVLDAGCGTAGLREFLTDYSQRYEIGEYVGIDLYTPAIQIARARHPGVTFIEDDFLAHAFDRDFDYVVSSGAFATHLNSNNYTVFEEAIRKMWGLARKGVAFNFLNEFNSNSSNGFFLYDSARILDVCREIAPAAQIRSSSARLGKFHNTYLTTIFMLQGKPSPI